MRRTLAWAALTFFFVATAGLGQDQTNPAIPHKRSWFGRIFHPFHSTTPLPDYKDPHLRGLLLQVQLPQEPVKLSEVRQLEVAVSLINAGKNGIDLSFPTEQRIEIYLRNASDKILTVWSENRAFAETGDTILINPQERLEYSETIATRDLTPNKVYIVEVFLPRYPELDVRRKFLTAP